MSQLLPANATAERITSTSKSNFSSSFFFLPSEKRKAIRRVYAFFRLIDDVVDEETDPFRQRALLDMWRREILLAYEGKSEVPLLKELSLSIRRFKIPLEYFLELISGCEMDINQHRYRTFEELYTYCYKVASIVGLTCMKIFEYESSTSKETAIALGQALQLTNIIRDVGVDLEKDRIYLPKELMDQFGVTEADLRSGQPTLAFRDMMEALSKKAYEYYRIGFAEFPKDRTGKLIAARIMGQVYRRLLGKIRRKKFNVFPKRIRLHFFQKMGILAKVLMTRS